MASVIKNNTFRNVLARTYAAQSAAAQSAVVPRSAPSISPERLQHSSLEGIPVVSIDNLDSLSMLAVLYKSGSRNESMDNLGFSHGLRSYFGMSAINFGAHGLTNWINLLGGRMFCETGREHTMYGVITLRENIDVAFDICMNSATGYDFKDWDVRINKDCIKIDNATMDYTTKLMDLLHSAAYKRGGLGNSLYFSDYKIDNINANELARFLITTHTNDRVTIVGQGIKHEYMKKLARGFSDRMEDHGSDVGTAPSQYIGGENWQFAEGPLAYVSVAGLGATFGSPEAAALNVASHILESSVKGLNNCSNGRLSAAIASVGGSGVASPLNINYSDSGLFGFMLVEEAAKAGDSTRAIVDAIRTLKVTEEDVKQAALKAKAAILMGLECMQTNVEDMGMQTLFSGNYCTPQLQVAALDKVTVAEVQSAISAMLKSKPSMAALGNIHTVPNIDQL